MKRLPSLLKTLPANRGFPLWPGLVLLALTLLCFRQLAFSGLILGRGDTYAYFYPYWAVRNAALMQGQLPLWSPEVFMGVPLLANPQLGTFYPLNWPLVPLSPPEGIRLSVLAHIFLALLGTYVLARRWQIGPIAALAAAAIFGLGGYLGAHVEQINQLQGLAWLPWLFWLYDRALAQPRRFSLPLAIGLALQFLTGHTQTVFITGVGLGVYGLALSLTRPSGERSGALLRAVGCLILAGALTLPLIVPQLIPTMELTGVSNRSGGLNPNEATAFSLNPFLLGRGLLPSYDGIIFGEYVAYGGVIGLGLAGIGLLIPHGSASSRARWIWGVLTLLGLLLALGEFNPLYWQLAHLPGFNFFRVPARWLALFALGMSLLAGIGLQALLDTPRTLRWPRMAAILGGILALAAGSLLAGQSPEEIIGSATPTAATWIGWALALAALMASIVLLRAAPSRWSRLAGIVPLGVLLAELIAASGVLPYNTLVLPEAYAAQRFTISQLQAYNADQTPPGRLLSISELLFDPGDRAALEARYAQYGLSDLAVRIQHIATKLKEIVAPNLPLVWGIPSIDGFDGGLLPTRYYTAFTRLMLPPDALATLDGRLREILARPACRGACLPDARWLNLTNTRYLLTDKVFDLWHAGIAYDTTFTTSLTPGAPLDLPNPNRFEANAVDLLFTGDTLPTIRLGGAILSAPDETGLLDDLRWGRWQADAASTAASVTIEAEEPVTLRALTLVDTRTGDFAQLVPDPNWRRVLSSDIKLYENQAVLPRAWVVNQLQIVPDTDEGTALGLDVMRDPAFDPSTQAILQGANPPLIPEAPGLRPAAAAITAYTSEHIGIAVDADQAGLLILTDSAYPGWQATVNGTPQPIHRADILFRAVAVPAGHSQVVFAYRPAWLPGSLIVGIIAWVLALIGSIGFARDSRLRSG